MEKPPFQFGLKAIFGMTTAGAVLMATVVHAPEFLIGISVASGMLVIVLLLVFGCFVWLMAGLLILLFDWLRKAPPNG